MKDDLDNEKLVDNIDKWVEQKGEGLYIHIPFCKYICSYCDFCKKKKKYFDTDEYIDLLIKELDMKVKYLENITTIYIGGGTPSALENSELEKLFNYLSMKLNFNNIQEFAIEANPDDISIELLDLFKENKITRISMGVQTLNNKILKELNRGHSKEDTEKALEILKKYDFGVNLDFMFNLPYQTKKDIELTIQFIKKNIDIINHISYYSLILEKNTVLYNKKHINFSEDLEDEIYKFIQKELAKINFSQYEISNYCKDSSYSKHNFLYWVRLDYLGVGLGASSLINNKRYKITESYLKYKHQIKNNEEKYWEIDDINTKEQLEEYIFLGLRTIIGISRDLLKKNNIKYDLKYFEVQKKNIKIKKEYYFISNQIILDLLEQVK